jgi:hypothetical protein
LIGPEEAGQAWQRRLLISLRSADSLYLLPLREVTRPIEQLDKYLIHKQLKAESALP